MKKSLKLIFWTLVGVFLLIVSEFFIPAVKELFRGSLLFLFPLAIFFLLGIVLLFLTLKQKVRGALKWFLILTGASAGGFFVSILLHNLVYGIFIYFFGSDFWNKVGLGDEPFFFFIAIFVCPIGFLIGVVGSIVLFVKKNVT